MRRCASKYPQTKYESIIYKCFIKQIIYIIHISWWDSRQLISDQKNTPQIRNWFQIRSDSWQLIWDQIKQLISYQIRKPQPNVASINHIKSPRHTNTARETIWNKTISNAVEGAEEPTKHTTHHNDDDDTPQARCIINLWNSLNIIVEYHYIYEIQPLSV